jgi:hypothetical protein
VISTGRRGPVVCLGQQNEKSPYRGDFNGPEGAWAENVKKPHDTIKEIGRK